MSRRFHKLWSEVAQRRDLSASCKIILAVLGNLANRTGHNRAGVRGLADECGMSVRGALNCLHRLRDLGLVALEGGRYQSRVEQSSTVSDAQGVEQTSTDGEQSATEAMNKVPHEKKENIGKRRPRGENFADLIPEHPALDTPEFRAAWAEWETFRREIKKPLTRSTAVKQLADLAKTPADAAARIEQSIRNGWRGLFEFKAKPSTQTPVDPSENWARALHGVNPDV